MESIIGLDHHGEEATAENLSNPGVVTVSKYFADGERGKVKDTEVNDMRKILLMPRPTLHYPEEGDSPQGSSIQQPSSSAA